MFWKGDEIVWENFLTHYLRSLQAFVLLFLAVGKNILLDATHVTIRRLLRTSHFTTDLERIHNELRRIVFSGMDIPYAISRLAGRKFHTDQVSFVFDVIHNYAFDVLSNLLHEVGYRTHKREPTITDGAFWKRFFDAIDASAPDVADLAFQIAQNHRHNRVLALLTAGQDGLLASNLITVLSDLPAYYLRHIESLVFPDWYAACFSKSHDNSSMWGHYADAHRGVCLVFDTQRNNVDKQFLPLLDARYQRTKVVECRDVDYGDILPEIDFSVAFVIFQVKKCWKIGIWV